MGSAEEICLLHFNKFPLFYVMLAIQFSEKSS